MAAVRYQAFEKLIGELKPIAEKLKCIVALGRVGQGEWETLEVKLGRVGQGEWETLEVKP